MPDTEPYINGPITHASGYEIQGFFHLVDPGDTIRRPDIAVTVVTVDTWSGTKAEQIKAAVAAALLSVAEAVESGDE